MMWAGREISTLSDDVLEKARRSVSGQVDRLNQAKPVEKYATTLANAEAMLEEIEAEQTKR